MAPRTASTHRGRIVKTTGDGVLVEFASRQCESDVGGSCRSSGLRPHFVERDVINTVNEGLAQRFERPKIAEPPFDPRFGHKSCPAAL